MWQLRQDKRRDYQYTFHYFNEYTNKVFNLSTSNRKQYNQQEFIEEKL